MKPQLNQLMQGPFWGPYCTLFRTLELVVGGLLLFCKICSQMPDQTTMLWLPRSMSASSRTPSRLNVLSASQTLILAVVLCCATAYICSAGQLPSYFQHFYTCYALSALALLVGHQEGHPVSKKGAGMVMCLE